MVCLLLSSAVAGLVGLPRPPRKQARIELQAVQSSLMTWWMKRFHSAEFVSALEQETSRVHRAFISHAPDDRVRRFAALLLLRRGTPASIAPLMTLMSNSGERVQDAAERAAVRILERSGSGLSLRFVSRHLRNSANSDASKARLARAILRVRGESAAEIVLGLLGSGPRLDQALLGNLTFTGAELTRFQMESFLDHLEAGMLSQESGMRRECARLVGVLREDRLSSHLLTLLQDRCEGVRANAHWALRELSGLNLRPDARRFRVWLQGEEEWAERFLLRSLGQLRDGSRADLLVALQEVARHPLYLREFREPVEDLLLDADPDLRRRAIEVLVFVRSRTSVPALVACLRDEDAAVADAAERALVALCGVDHGVDEEAWLAYYAAHPTGSMQTAGGFLMEARR